MVFRSLTMVLAALCLSCGGAAARPVAGPALQIAPAAPSPPPSLTKADVDTWLDGLIPYALASGDIAGAVVVVVKDGQILTERGFGYDDMRTRRPVDPARTLFRPGSVAKLFTWTAVMQQVEAGKLDLDRDVNAYLDFKIPPREGKPITLRNLMTHTPGFEEQYKNTFGATAESLGPIGKYLAGNLPKRIYAPGEVPAYSNYGATLAGYIVQRVSGEPFNAYVERHIFQPLGMARSTFVQPLPSALAVDMSKGYVRASQPPKPFEFINVGPAGALSATGEDMARFMTAFLQAGQYGGARILAPQTVQDMWVQQTQFDPPIPALALGFYHEDRNGRRIVGHEGDTTPFHSDLHLMPDDHVGLFISLNSLGKEGAAGPIRQAFLRGFLNRYFPVPPTDAPTAATAQAHARLMAGHYWFSRRSDSNFLRILNLLGQAKVTANPDGTIQVSTLVDASRAPKIWREVAPFRWTDKIGSILVAVVKDGQVVNFVSDDLPPVLVFQPVPAWADAGWSLPLLLASIAVLLLTVLIWPLQALIRRRYGRRFDLAGRRATLYRATRVTAIVQLAALGAYVLIFALLSGGAVSFNDALDPVLIVAQALCVLGVLGVAVLAWNAYAVWASPGRSWWARASSLIILLAGVGFAWFVVTLRLANFSLAY